MKISEKNDKDSELIRYCQTQKIGWQEKLVHWLGSTEGWLKRRCALRLGSNVDADDAVQEVTLKVISAIEKFEGRSALKTWVVRIADNHCSSMLRLKSAKTMTTHLQYCIAISENDRFDRVDDEVEKKEHVQLTLNMLTVKEREILQLRFYGELSFEDISNVLNLSLSGAKMRFYRAINAFEKNHNKQLF